MEILRGLLIFLIFFASFFPGFFPHVSRAEEFPAREIKLVVPLGPGGGVDVAARIFAEKVEKILGVPIVVVNNAAGGGVVGVLNVAQAKPDGYTLLYAPTGTIITKELLTPKLPYRHTDFTAISQLVVVPVVVFVNPDAPWKSLKEIIDYAKANPNQLKIGTSAMQGSSAIMTKYVGYLAGVQWTLVPFDSDAQIITALLGNHIHAGVNNGAQIPHVKAGTLRMLAFYTAERINDFPDIPTFKEMGYDVVTDTLAGVVGPRGLPEPIVQKLIPALVKARESESFLSANKTYYLQPQKEVGKEYEKRIMEIYSSLDKYLKIK